MGGYPSFPRTLAEFQEAFPTDAACLDYLIRVRWPEGFECPRCGHRFAWSLGRKLFRCRRCRLEASVTAGTVMHGTRLPLRHWFWAAHLMSTLTPGISALQLQRQIGLKSYRTALSLCRRLRRAMVNPLREPLCGVVEVDEALVGGPRRGKFGRGSTKPLVAVAVENRGDHTGRVRLALIPDASQASLHAFVRRHIAPGSQVNTDDWDSYKGLGAYGYQHRPRVQGDPARAAKILHWVHRVIGNLKTWLRGTHHGRVERGYLQSYLEEFTFRYNRRRSREHSFLSLLVMATRISPPQTVPRRQVESSA